MDRALKTFIVGTVVANIAVFGFRALVYFLNYLAVDDLANGDLSALDKIHTYRQWMVFDLWATVVSGFVVSRLQRQWMDAGNANALTRSDVGLGWFRGVPSGKAFQRWQWAQMVGYLAIVVLGVAFHNSLTTTSQVLAWAAVEVSLCSVIVAASIAGAFSARDMTAQLLERVAAPEHMVSSEHTVSSEHMVSSEQAARSEQLTVPDPTA